MHQNVALVKTTREAVGDNVDIMADAYMGWNLEHARRMLRMLAPYNMRWVEEPVISDDLHAYAELKALNIVNISGGEHEYTIHGFRDTSRPSISPSSMSIALAASPPPRRSQTSTTTSPCRAMPGRSRNTSPRFRSKSATSSSGTF